MQSRSDEFQAADADILAISVDLPEQSAEIVEAYGLTFPVLSDPGAETIRAFGVLHEAGGPYGDIARPASFILDREGNIVWRDLTENWRVRVRPDRVLEELRRIP